MNAEVSGPEPNPTEPRAGSGTKPDILLHGPFGPPREHWMEEVSRLRKMEILARDGMPMRLPGPPPGAVPVPGAELPPWPAHRPKPPPHLDPHRSAEERAAAYRVLFAAWRAERPYRAALPDNFPDLYEASIGWNQ